MISTSPWGMAVVLRAAADGQTVFTPLMMRIVADQLEALSRIHTEMDGREWNSETAHSIAEDLRSIGLVVRSSDECTCGSHDGEPHAPDCPLWGAE